VKEGTTLSLAVDPSITNVSSVAASGLSIGVSGNVSWTAGTTAAWLAVTGGASGTSNGTVTFSVADNAGTSARTGGVVVAGWGLSRTCTVVQLGSAAAALDISPASTNVSSAAAGQLSIGVTANVAWTATTNAAWIAVMDGSSGSGNGTVTFSVAANAGTTVRTGGVIVAGGAISRTCTVIQAGAAGKPQIQADENFGVVSNLFGFNINWVSGRVVVVDACTNLANPAWTSLQTNVLSNTPTYFSDPKWTNLMGRFYRIRAP
jgi:hypothetical protein